MHACTCVCVFVLHLLLFCCCSVHVFFWLCLTPAVFPSTQAARTLKSQLLATVHLPCIFRGVATLPHRECQCSCARSTAVVAERGQPKGWERDIESESDSAWYPCVKAKAENTVRERDRERVEESKIKRAKLRERKLRACVARDLPLWIDVVFVVFTHFLLFHWVFECYR